MGKIIGRPFLDKSGTIGASRVRTIHNTPTPDAKPYKRVTYEDLGSDTPYLLMHVPVAVPAKVKISKRNGLKLAHWLLEVCNSPR